MSLDLSDEVMSSAADVAVKESDKGLKVGDKELSSKEVAATLRYVAGQGHALLVNTPMTRCYMVLDKSWGQRDPVISARALVSLNIQALPLLGVRPFKEVDLSKMPRRHGASAAAFAAADTLEQFPPVMDELPQTVAALRRNGTAAHTFYVLRESYRALDRQIGANELQVLPALRTDLTTTVTELQTKMASNPLIMGGLEPVVEYMEGAAQQGADSRRRNDANREETENALREKIEAAAREEGRRETMTAVTDKLSTAFVPKK